jgi:hypothetical protein
MPQSSSLEVGSGIQKIQTNDYHSSHREMLNFARKIS